MASIFISFFVLISIVYSYFYQMYCSSICDKFELFLDICSVSAEFSLFAAYCLKFIPFEHYLFKLSYWYQADNQFANCTIHIANLVRENMRWGDIFLAPVTPEFQSQWRQLINNY